MPRTPDPERDAQRNAARLARDEVKRAARDYVSKLRERAVAEALATQAALDAVRGEPLKLPAEVDYSQLPTISMVGWTQALALLLDLGRNGSTERVRSRNAELAAATAIAMRQQLAEEQAAAQAPQPQAQPSAAAAAALTDPATVAQVRDVLSMRRQLMRQGAG